MKSILGNRCLVLILAISTMMLQRGALAQSKHSPLDTVLVVFSAGTAFPTVKDDPNTTKRLFIPFRDQLTAVDAILQSQDGQDFGPRLFKVEIIRGDQTIPLEINLNEFFHHPVPPPADTFLQKSDAMIIRPKVPTW